MRQAVYLTTLMSLVASGCLTASGQGSSSTASPSSPSNLKGTTHLLDDFEAGAAKSGAAWSASADQNNLGSQANFELKDSGAEGKGKAGYFKGHLGRNVAPWPWASLAIGIKPDQSPADISAVKAVRFWVKGDGKTYKMALPKASVTDYANFGATFDAPKMDTVEIPLDKLTQANWGKQVPRTWDDVRLIEFQPTIADSDFEILIDNVELVVDPSKPNPLAPKEEAPVHVDGKELLVDDFDAKGPRNGAVWGAEMDMNNLGTIATYRLEDSGDAERKMAAHYKGKLGKNGAPWPWSTLAINADPNAKPVDFSAVKAVRFWAKGSGEMFSFALSRKVVTDYGNFKYSFVMPTTWKQITIPIERLKQPDWAAKVPAGWADVTAMQWSPVTGDAAFDVWIDNVELITDPAKPAPFKAQ